MDRSLDFISFTNNNLDWLGYTDNDTVPATGPCHLRVEARGTNLTCELVDSGLLLNASDTANPTGTVGFFTSQTSACFDYLVVLQ